MTTGEVQTGLYDDTWKIKIEKIEKMEKKLKTVNFWEAVQSGKKYRSVASLSSKPPQFNFGPGLEGFKREDSSEDFDLDAGSILKEIIIPVIFFDPMTKFEIEPGQEDKAKKNTVINLPTFR